MSGLMLSVLCLDPITSKSRFIDDIKIRCFCPSAEMIPASDPRDPVRSYESGDIVRVVVLEVMFLVIAFYDSPCVFKYKIDNPCVMICQKLQ